MKSDGSYSEVLMGRIALYTWVSAIVSTAMLVLTTGAVVMVALYVREVRADLREYVEAVEQSPSVYQD